MGNYQGLDTFSDFDGIRMYISNMPLDTDCYVDDYIEIVANNYRDYLYDQGWSYGDELPQISDEIFWSFYRDAEKT